jgi:hypothetical protein
MKLSLRTLGSWMFRRPPRRSKWARAVRLGVPALAVAYLLLLSFPQVVFPCEVSYKNFRVYSARPIDRNIYAILDKAQARLAASGIDDPAFVHRIFLCDDPLRYRLFAPRSVGSFGVSLAPLGNTFLARSDIAADRVYREAEAHRTRTLSGAIAHEQTHHLLARHFGLLRDYRTPDWKKEGFCDYVSGAPTLDRAEGLRMIREGRGVGSGPYRYFTYYLTMKYLIETKGYRLDEIFSGGFFLKDPEAMLGEITRDDRP